MESGSLNPRKRLPVGRPTKRELTLLPSFILCLHLFIYICIFPIRSPPKKARRTKVKVEIKKKGSGGGKARKGGRE
jgi:hypothetical protein